MAEDSGYLRLEGDTIRYSSATYGSWELPLSKLRILGESTNQNGPWLDDYFFIFVADGDGWYEASFYAKGRDEFLAELSSRLGQELSCKLIGSADFASNILWPISLVGVELFEYRQVKRVGLLGKLRDAIHPSNMHSFSSNVIQWLENNSKIQ